MNFKSNGAGSKLIMVQRKLNRLNDLFEKAVADKANVIERRELKVLYQEYIDDGREITLPIQDSIYPQHATAS
ncbi:MAG: hypothetical protein ACI9O3_000955 [Colwellia sp.]|jgi:hypothetical protein|uniref:hypothetical protein n=1 Tax=unclassified Colwellia TaxID=196834 RepID=UPI0015F3ED16|nr:MULTISPECIES: hypothetical protein [unclassified Colwellia]MBA6337888.1 hypothetical protein [Colwellia sp. BRX8-7]MBA6397471.1 hypothetical protein [Colwellia sp. BRX10-4]